MLGDNPIRRLEHGDGSHLMVKTIFKTLQGEGLHVGVPSIFLRLGGCNLACNFCDTEFEDFKKIPVELITNQIQNLSLNDQNIRSVHLVVITGGEPFRQPIAKLCRILLNDNFGVQIETNGTIYREVPPGVDIICSPKVVNGKYHSIRDDLLKRISAFKFLISDGRKEYSAVPDLGQVKYNVPVFVQAMDELDPEINMINKKLAVEIAINKGYRLSYQIHKDLGIE
jgi:7-carboxy-7-deazaguanine synthase